MSFSIILVVDVEFVEIDWDNKILELDAKTVDCIWNGMTLTDEVKNSMKCSNAYCNNAQVVVVNAAVAANYPETMGSSEGKYRLFTSDGRAVDIAGDKETIAGELWDAVL